MCSFRAKLSKHFPAFLSQFKLFFQKLFQRKPPFCTYLFNHLPFICFSFIFSYRLDFPVFAVLIFSFSLLFPYSVETFFILMPQKISFKRASAEFQTSYSPCTHSFKRQPMAKNQTTVVTNLLLEMLRKPFFCEEISCSHISETQPTSQRGFYLCRHSDKRHLFRAVVSDKKVVGSVKAHTKGCEVWSEIYI